MGRLARVRSASALLVLPVLAALAALILLSLYTLSPEPGEAARWSVEPYRTAARTYLTRNAFLNTLYTTSIAAPVAYGAAMLIYPALWASVWPRRVTGALLAAALLTPVVPVVGVWRTVWEPTLWLTDARSAIGIAGLVLGWRLVPVCVLGRWWMDCIARRGGMWRNRWGLPGLLPVVWLAALDVPVVYLLTRGEPFNAAHTAATWAVQQAWVARHWDIAAVIGVLLSLWTLAVWIVGQQWFLAPTVPAIATAGPASSPRVGRLQGVLATGSAALLLPLPIWLGMVDVDWLQMGATFNFLWHAGVAGWLGNTLGMILGTGVLAWGLLALLLPGVARIRFADRLSVDRLGSILLWAGMLGLFVWYLPLGRLQAESGLGRVDARAVLIIVQGLTAALLLGGALLLSHRGLGDSTGQGHGRGVFIPVGSIGMAALLVQQDFALSLFVQQPVSAQWYGTAALTQLAGVPAYPHVLQWLAASLFSGFFLVGLILLIFLSRLRLRGRSG